MKKLLLASILAMGSLANANAQRSCAAHTHLHQLEAIDPTVAPNRNAIEEHTNSFLAKGGYGHTRAVVTIPVVVHVLYNNTTSNISDAQINSQMAVLNADFSKTNADIVNVPTAFQSLAANPDIQFCLAKRDPNGAATTGITRTAVTKSVFDADTDDCKSTATGGVNAWPASSYLNIWIVPSLKAGTLTGILGYAQFPGGPAATDGIVFAHMYTGTTGTAQAPFNKGRTATHEVGHWLNCYHIWGDDDNDNGSCTASSECTGSDLVGDTPNQCERNYGCPTFPRTDGCTPASPGVMYMNYMDYTDDACMYMFTPGQVSRMQALFATGGSKASLKTSLGCVAPTGGATCGISASLSAGTPTQTSATLSWGAVSGATNYTLQYKTSSATTYTTIGSLTSTTYNLTGLTAGTTYNWQVSATCATATSAYATASFNTASTTPSCSDIYEANNTRTAGKTIAVNTNITGIISSSTDQDWFKFTNTTTNKNIKVDLTNLPLDYDLELYRGSAKVGTSALGSTSAEQIKYNNGSVTTYYVKVFGYNGAFNTTSCYTLRASLSATAWRNGAGEVEEVTENINLDKIQRNLDVQAYPNPSNGNITLEILNLTNATEANISIVDITGKVVYQSTAAVNATGVSTQNVNLNVANGMYQVLVRCGDAVHQQKIIVQQ